MDLFPLMMEILTNKTTIQQINMNFKEFSAWLLENGFECDHKQRFSNIAGGKSYYVLITEQDTFLIIYSHYGSWMELKIPKDSDHAKILFDHFLDE